MKADNLKIDNSLEALRGFAAVIVVMQHIIVNHIDANYHPSFLNAFLPPGNLCVLVFFMLSGYVIGISNKNKLMSSTILIYLKKRFVRIYPIYFISLILALLVKSANYQLFTVICNFTLMQDLLSPVIMENGPVWSLHYEVVYYLLFIPISYFNINPFLIFMCSIIISFINYFLFSHIHTPIISTYLNGLSFWILGLIIARYFTTKEQDAKPSLLMSNVFLILSMSSFHITSTIFNNLSMHFFKHYLEFPTNIYWAKTKVGFADLMFLPYCFVFITVFSNINFRYKKIWILVLQVIPVLCIYTFIKTYSSETRLTIIVSSIFYCISLFLFFSNTSIINHISMRFINAGKWLGSISYGIYIIHFPILVLFSKILFFSSTGVYFIIRLIIFIVLVIGISYILEKRFQTWVKKLFYSKKINANGAYYESHKV